MSIIDSALVQGLRPNFTNDVIARVNDIKNPQAMFGMSLFTPKTSSTAIFKWVEKHYLNYDTVDMVSRSAEPNWNEFGVSTEKDLIAPVYAERFSLNDLTYFNTSFQSNNPSESAWNDMLTETANAIISCKNKINVQIEKSCMSILLDDTFSFLNPNCPTTYNRGSWSKIDYATGNNFANNSNDPFQILDGFCTTLRNNGNLPGTTEFICVVAKDVWFALSNNAKFQAQVIQPLSNVTSELVKPQLGTNGTTLKGYLSCGGFIVHLFTYDNVYVDRIDNTYKNFMTNKKLLLVPVYRDFVLGYGATLMTRSAPGINTQTDLSRMADLAVEGQYSVSNYYDSNRACMVFTVKSSAIPILANKNHVLSAQVLAP